MLAAAYGRKEGDFIAGGKLGAECGIFLIDRSGDAGAELEQAREAAAVTLVEIFDARAFGELGEIFADAGDFAKLAEEKNAHAHGFIVDQRNDGLPFALR